jgi:hypothetical protein
VRKIIVLIVRSCTWTGLLPGPYRKRGAGRRQERAARETGIQARSARRAALEAPRAAAENMDNTSHWLYRGKPTAEGRKDGGGADEDGCSRNRDGGELLEG